MNRKEQNRVADKLMDDHQFKMRFGEVNRLLVRPFRNRSAIDRDARTEIGAIGPSGRFVRNDDWFFCGEIGGDALDSIDGTGDGDKAIGGAVGGERDRVSAGSESEEEERSKEET